MLAERAFVSWEAQKPLKTLRIEGGEEADYVRQKEEGTKAKEKTFSSYFHHFLSFKYQFLFVLSPPC